MSAPPRPPAMTSSASTTMDFPAPVSPVSAVRPGPKSSSASSTMTKSRSCRCVSKCRLLAVAVAVAVAAEAPMKFGAQQAVIVVARRVQQSDLCVGALDEQRIALLQIANAGAVARHLGMRPEAIRHTQLNGAAGAHHNRPIAQRVWADGRQNPHVEIRLEDGPAARHGIGG